jgi:hypothetical protein
MPPVFQSVVYVDPWGSITPGTQFPGVQVAVRNGAQAPPESVLWGRLLQGTSELHVNQGVTASAVSVPVPGPLGAAVPYSVQAAWSPTTTEPDWTAAGVVTAPVVTAGMLLTDGTMDALGTAALSWAPVAAAQPLAAAILIFDKDGMNWIADVVPGSGATGLALETGQSFAAYVACATLIDPNTPDAYSTGPLAAPVLLPGVAPALTGVSYDGMRLTAAWTPPAPPAPSLPPQVDPGYLLVVSSPSGAVAFVPAGPAGGGTVIDLGAVASPVTVTAALRAGRLTGPPGHEQQVITAAPGISSVTMAASRTAGATDVTVTVTKPAGLPPGATVTVTLLRDGAPVATATASGSPAKATITHALPGSGYAVAAQARLVGPPGVTGPSCRPLALVVGQVTPTLSYDGEYLHVSWPPAGDTTVTGYTIGLGTLGSVSAGLDGVLQIPARLKPGDTVTATVTPTAGAVTGITAPATTFVVPAPAAPTITQVEVTGCELALRWTPSPGPWLDGYQVVLTGSRDGGGSRTATIAVGPALVAKLPLARLDGSWTWSVTVAATARGVPGLASAPTALFGAVAVLTAVRAGSASATVTWALTPELQSTLQALADAGAKVQAQLLDGGTVLASSSVAIVATSSVGSVNLDLPTPSTALLSAAVRVVTDAQAGARSRATAVLFDAPNILWGELDADMLHLRWSAAVGAGVQGYQVSYGQSASAVTGDTQIALPLTQAPAAGDTISVAATGGVATGPAISRGAVTPYAVASGSYDGRTLTLTITAAGPPTPEYARVRVLAGGTIVASVASAGAPSSAVTVPVLLEPGRGARVQISGVGSGSLAAPSAAVAIPAAVPRGVTAVWDGANMHVAWVPVDDPGVSGYLVTVSGATPPARYVSGAGTGSAVIPVAYTGAFPGTANVTVRASARITDADHRLDGPVSPSAVPQLAGGIRTVTVPATGQPPYLYRRGAYQTLAQVRDQPVVVYLDSPFPAASGTPTVTDGGASPTFTLAPVNSPIAGCPGYRLTVAQTAWTFDGTSARAGLRASYRMFLRKVEAATPQPWGIALVRQAVATALPQTFAETLYYRYGLWRDASLRAVDLESGMRLRITGAAYEAPIAALSDPRNGFVALGTETYDLAEVFPAGSDQPGLGPALAIDSFLAALLSGAGAASSTTVAAGPTDLFAVGGRQPYFRLLYPSALPGSGLPGSSAPVANVVMLGASTWTALEDATSSYAATGNLPVGPSLFIAYFRGRAALTPLISVTVDRHERWVPVGATARTLLAGLGLPVGAPRAGDAATLRRTLAGIDDFAQGGPPVAAEPVLLDGAELGAHVPQLWPLDVPLLGGDVLTRVASAVPSP